jgi:hypothetical protein
MKHLCVLAPQLVIPLMGTSLEAGHRLKVPDAFWRGVVSHMHLSDEQREQIAAAREMHGRHMKRWARRRAPHGARVTRGRAGPVAAAFVPWGSPRGCELCRAALACCSGRGPSLRGEATLTTRGLRPAPRPAAAACSRRGLGSRRSWMRPAAAQRGLSKTGAAANCWRGCLQQGLRGCLQPPGASCWAWPAPHPPSPPPRARRPISAAPLPARCARLASATGLDSAAATSAMEAADALAANIARANPVRRAPTQFKRRAAAPAPGAARTAAPAPAGAAPARPPRPPASRPPPAGPRPLPSPPAPPRRPSRGPRRPGRPRRPPRPARRDRAPARPDPARSAPRARRPRPWAPPPGASWSTWCFRSSCRPSSWRGCRSTRTRCCAT